MNELEKQKQMSEEDKVQETSKRLAEGFLALADLLQDNLLVSRECVLTAFSVHPTWPCMERIENLAISCGALNSKQDSDETKNKYKPSVENNDSIMQLNNISDKTNSLKEVPPLDTGQGTNTSKQSVFSNTELSKVLVPQTLGLSEQLCDDLAVIMSGPRYQYLSWVLDWPELKTACHGYLVNSERKVVKELKYLNIDYNQFKDWPDDSFNRYGGIEKGYEQYTEDEENSNTESDYMSYDQGYNDSDSSITAGRRRRKVRKLYSSDSDYEIHNRKTDNSSDIDTASQDADSLGSDGLQPAFGTPKSNISPPRPEPISPFTILMNSRNEPNRKLLSIFNHRDRNEGQPHMFDNTGSLIHSFLLPEKRASDPKTLKTLRMFRSNKKRDRDVDNKLSKSSKKAEGSLKLSDGKVIKLPLTPSMNPRVLLDRQDCNNLESKYMQKKNNIVKQDNKDTECLHKFPPKISEANMNPRVILDRYDDLYSIYKTNQNINNKKQHTLYSDKEKKSRTLEVLADVPGLNSLEMIRPSVVQPTVQVVQVTTNLQNTQQIRPAKSQNATSATTSSLITSTPVTAHIQRVGHVPQAEKLPEDSQENQSPGSSQSSTESRISIVSPDSGHATQSETTSPITQATKPPNSQSTPTLVNILSQQIIRPAQASTPTSRNSTLINILSQQIIKPPMTQLPQKIFNVATSSVENVVNVSEVRVGSNEPQNTVITTTAPSVATTVAQLQLQNSIKLVSTTQAQPVAFQHIINAQGKNNNQVLKNVNLVTNSTNAVDATRLVQFLCKTDGKVVHLTPYPNANIKLQTIDPTKLIKTTTVISKPTTTQPQASRSSIPSPVRSSYEENFSKFIQTNTRSIPVKTIQGEFSSADELVNSLPKFQQAFGKAGYQTTNATIDPSVEVATTCSTSLTTSVSTSDTNTSKTATALIAKSVNTTTAVTAKPIMSSKSAMSPLGVQTIQGSVIYTRQVPVSLAISSSEQINLIPATSVAQAAVSRNVLRLAPGEQINVSKDNVIMRNKMNQLLAAALQSNVPNRSSAVVSTITTTLSTVASTSVVTSTVASTYTSRKSNEAEICDVDSSSNDSNCVTSTVTNATPTLVTPMRITLPMMQRTPGPNGMQTTRIVRPILQIPQSMIRGSAGIRQQVLLATATPVAMTGVVTCAPQQHATPVEENIMTNIEPAGQPVSSTTLEQLREFDLVLEQVKERSTTVQPTPVQNKIQVVKPSTSTNTDLQEVISNVSVTYMNPNQITQKVTSCASVVVVTSYCNVQPAASPALSVTSQSSSSPCVTPAPSSSGKTVPKTSAKSPKSKTVKTTAHTSKTSPIPKPQQKPQEDEQTTQRIFDILAEYAEQLRNSPDLNNKPAPRRRSNPPTNPSQNSKRKKCSSSKKTVSVGQCNSVASELSPGTDDPRTMGSEDSCGIVQLSVQNSPQETTVTDDHQSSQCSSDFSNVRSQQAESSESSTVESQLPQPGRQFIFTDSNTNQSRNVIIADSAVSETLVGKLSNTAAVIVPANYIVPMVKGGQQIAVVSGSSKILATVPARSGSNMLLFQSFVNQSRKPISTQGGIKTVKYSTVQPLQGQIIGGVNTQTPVVLSPSTETVTLTHPLSFKKIGDKTSIITTDKAASGESIITTTNIQPSSTVTSQKCNVILASGSVADMNRLNVIAESSSSPADHTEIEEDDKDKSMKQTEQCVKILPVSDSVTTENESVKIVDNVQTNTLIQSPSFSINFISKESSTVPVFSQIVAQSPSTDKDSLKTKMSETENKPQHSIIRTIIDNTNSEKIVSTTSSAFTRMDCSPTVDHYSKSK